jgi:hypothetical protein
MEPLPPVAVNPHDTGRVALYQCECCTPVWSSRRNNLWVAMLQRMGVKVSSLGDSTGVLAL